MAQAEREKPKNKPINNLGLTISGKQNTDMFLTAYRKKAGHECVLFSPL